ncbi:MAG: class D sortase [Bryobacteraceae bacterium]
MRLLVAREPLRRILKWTQRALSACAFLLLGYCAFALLDAWNFQRRESRDFDRALNVQRVAGESRPQPESFPSPKAAAVAVIPAAETKGLIGRLEIPRLLLSTIVVEGIGRTTLRRVVGHIPGTALPGQPGNVGLAGHRDTLFRSLKDLKINDEIQFSTLHGDFKYIVESLVIVEPDNVGVLASSSENELTLVTCYPFFFVGAAPKRFVVKARQVSPPTALPSIVE